MSVCCVRCVLSGRGLSDKPITRPEESYQLCCVGLFDQKKNLVNEEAIAREIGLQRQRGGKKKKIEIC